MAKALKRIPFNLQYVISVSGPRFQTCIEFTGKGEQKETAYAHN